MRAGHIHLRTVHRNDQDLLTAGASFGEDLPGGPRHKALAPKLEAVTARGTFQSNAIHRHDITSVGHRMTALHQFPGAVLVCPILGLLPRMPANRRRVEEDFGPLQRGETGCFWEPLIPADQYA